MSVNYNNKDGTFSTLAAGSRVWIGTSSAFETSKNNIPNNTAIYITDDTVTSPYDTDITASVTSDTSFYNAFTTAANNATYWESFSGSTMNGYGGAWFGYKRTSSITAMIIWHETIIKGFYNEAADTWSFKTIL